MKKQLARILSVILMLALLFSALPVVGNAESSLTAEQSKLLEALVKAVEPTNKILADRRYNPKPIAQISFDVEAMSADLMMLDTEKRAIKMLEVPFLKELFSYKDIYALQIGDSAEDYVEYERLNQFSIMLSVGHSTIGEGMDLEGYYVWLRNLADTLTITAMDGHSTDITIICRTDHEDEDTEYSLTISLRLYNKYHNITWKFNNGEEDYVKEKVAYGASILKPNPTPPAGMKFYRWDPEVPAVMGTTDLEFSAVWIPENHAGYTVRHFHQNIDAEQNVVITEGTNAYSVAEIEYLSAEIGSSFVGSSMAKTFEGFKLNGLGDAAKTVTVTNDVNLTLNLYYDRVSIKIIWDWGFKKVPKGVKYGLMPVAPDMPTPPDDSRDYEFVRWDREIVPAAKETTYKARYADDKALVVTLAPDGGSVSETVVYLYVGDTFSMLPAPTREGYRFEGWFYEDGTPVDKSAVIEEDGAVTVVAHWTIKQYSITFDADGGVWPDGSTDNYVLSLEYGTLLEAPEPPSKKNEDGTEDYAFWGWQPLLPYTMPAKTLYVTAQWHLHELVPAPAVAPTCTTPGHTAGEECSNPDCGYATYEVIPALGHTLVAGETVAPTCTADGYTVYTCSVCGATENGDIVPAKGHTWDDGKVTLAPTDTEEGLRIFTCTVCGATKTEIIPATGESACQHANWEYEHEDPTCTEDGYDRKVCSDCGRVLSEETIPALGHDIVTQPAVPATCTTTGLTAGEYCTRCDYRVDRKTVPELGHDLIIDVAAIPATCTASGMSEGSHCTRCDFKTEPEIVEALDHDFIIDPAVAPTCTETGLTQGSHCSRCDVKVEQEVLPALGHDYVVSGVSATCTEDGAATYACARCGDSYTEVVPALGHDYVYFDASAPTCTVPGWDAYQTCTRCDYTTYAEIPAPGHNFVDGICTVCGERDPDYVVLGDVNGDGEVDTIDAIRLARFLVDLAELTDKQKQAADVNSDGDVTATDAIRLAKYLVGLIDTLEK